MGLSFSKSLYVWETFIFVTLMSLIFTDVHTKVYDALDVKYNILKAKLHPT